MKILTVPNWSIHEPRLTEIVRDVLSDLEVKIHYAQSDPDHERAVIAFSGESDFVIKGLKRLCERLFPLIDMNHNHGVHPHCGALDVCPFVSLTRN